MIPRILIAIGLGALVLALWLVWRGSAAHGSGTTAEPLVVFCAAGFKPVMEKAIPAFTAATGQPVVVQYGGSGSLLTTLRLAPFDVFVSADRGHAAIAQRDHLVTELVPLARQRPVLAVKRGNPLGLRTVDDLLRPGVRVACANPESASIGQLVRERLSQAGRWDALAAHFAVQKPTVMEVASDVVIGAADAALVWDATVRQLSGLEAVELPELAGAAEEVTAGIASASPRSAAGLALARWLSAPGAGVPLLTAHGYEAMPGDVWSAKPQLTFFSGSVNRGAVEGALKDFSKREGVEITTVYNGCGILCAAIKDQVKSGGQVPDAYYACDVCFVAPVAEHYPEAVMMTETDIVIATRAGNPLGLRTLVDLARPGIRLGVCNAEQATLGYLTTRMLDQLGVRKAVMANAVVEVPTGDLLTLQLRAGSLDAAIVYRINALKHPDLAVVAIDHTAAKAVQPFAVAAKSPNRLLAGRLLAFLQARPEAFTTAGFRWRGNEAPVASSTLPMGPAGGALLDLTK